MGFFMYVSRCQAMFEGFLASVGKECKTTFYSDLSIAEHYGAKAVVDTYRRVMAEWGDDLEYMCEWVVALNQKIWQHYEQNEPLTRIYDELWRKADNYCREHFKGADLVKYYRYID